MSVKLLRFVPILLLACATAACDSGGSDAADPTPSPTPAETAVPPTPTGHTYISKEVQGPQIPGGGPLTLTFTEDGRVSVTAGCNTGSAPVTLDNNTLTAGQLATTLMGCEGDRARADEWMGGLLASAPSWELKDSTLTLKNQDQTVILLDKKIATPDKPLEHTVWRVTQIITPDARIASVAIDESKPTLALRDNGISGSAGCNKFSGKAPITKSAAGNTIEFNGKDFGTTRMVCQPDVMEVEAGVLKALTGTVTLTIDADILTLKNAEGNGLVLRAEP
ncbi:META domain-containing protein [Nocardia sp. XZ_19_385]|uniref:META domain-containing protein n=1 Tax=Nocardia sp. XZ_19_385 TaxID=2769488 RepID=UPI00188EB04D|nr:META domain-containing protein [Nocardia sp. XZ_19_385]